MAKDTITIDGLAQFSKALRKMDADLPKAMRLGFNDVANIVVDTARPRIPSKSGRARGSLKARSTRTAVRIVAGGSRARYFPWLDFGGEGRVRGRPGKRPFYSEGRYVWKAFAERRKDVTAALEKSLVDLAESAGLEVS